MNKTILNTARTEFASAVAQIAKERNLDPQIIFDAIKQAKLAAFKKDYPSLIKTDYVYEVELDLSSGEAQIFEIPAESLIQEGITQLRPLAGAKRQNVTPPGFGRIAAQTARQVIMQKIREAEKSVIINEYEKRLGTIVNGMVLRHLGNEVIVDIGKTEAIMPTSEQVKSEDYHPNTRMTFFLQSIVETPRGREVVVSRADSGLVRELFRREVPEISSGSVEIKVIARDPGSRTKIAVYSHQSGIDPVGSCVGQKGVRVQAVINELLGEKIDVIQFSDDPEKFIVSALQPATELNIDVDLKKKIARVSTNSENLPLAIGRDGANAKLAGKLTGYHIDITLSETTNSVSKDSHSHSQSDSNTITKIQPTETTQ